MEEGTPHRETGFSARVLFPSFVLLCGLAATALATCLVAENLEVRNRQHLTEGIHQVVFAIESRMEAYVSLLRGGAGVFAAKPQVSKAEFRKFYDRLEIPQRYPGIQGYGYSVRVPAERVGELVRAAREQGMPSFKVWPDSRRDEYHAIIFLEPEDERNRAAIGYDMFTESVRSNAMAQARDTGNAVFSGRVRLVQEIDNRTQAGFLLYVPVYQGGSVPPSLEERRQKLQGYIYSPFRAGDLFSAMLPGHLVPGLEVAIWDETNAVPENLLYQSDARVDPALAQEKRTVQVAGREWTVSFITTDAFGRAPGASLLALLPLVGILASGWLSALARKEANARWRSERDAHQLSTQREWLDVTLASIADAVITTDTTGRIEFMNAAAEGITGEQAEQTCGRPIAEFFSIRDEKTGQVLASPAERVLSTGDVVRFNHDVVLRTRSGLEKHIDPSAAPLRSRKNELIGAVLVFRETQERRMFEQALAESEQLYRAIAETAADGVMVTNEEARILMANSAIERIFGYSAEELTGQDATILLPECRRPEARRCLDEFLRTGERKVSWAGVQTPGLRRDGSEVPLEISVGAARRGGRFIFTCFLRDITERKRAEEAIRELNQDLETRVERRTAALLESKEQMESFTYTVAHDLRAPLRAMQGFAHALLEDYGPLLAAEGHDYLRRVMISAERMDRLIQDLLAYSQLSRSDLQVGSVRVREAIEAALEQQEAEIRKKKARVILEVAESCVQAHSITLEHALSNLISNGLKFIPPGAEPRLEIRTKTTPASTFISVRDNGIGIAREHQDRIFRVFERLHGPEEYPGTGIGLAIVKKGIERMGGHVGLRSEVGQGTEFWIELRNAN